MAPHYKPTDALREKVKSFKRAGINNEDIARCLGISHDTLTRHYGKELDTGRQEAVHEMAGHLFKKGIEGDVTAQIFYLKTQGRWRTEDSKLLENSNEVKEEIKKIRENLDAKNKKEY